MSLWMVALALGVLSPCMGLPCSWLDVRSWPTGFKGVLKVKMDETVDHWTVCVEFSQPVVEVEAWKGIVTENSGTNYNICISNKCYNNILYECQYLVLPFVVRTSKLWAGSMNFTFNGVQLNTCPEDPSSDPTTITTTANTTTTINTTTTSTITKTTTTGCPQAQLTVNTANAVNNNALNGVLVTLLEQGQVLDQTTTSAGEGHLTSPHSEVVLTAELAGFTMAPVTILVVENECERTIELSLSPNTSIPARVVMNWGPLPHDLDLHAIQVKNGSEICRVNYGNRECDGFALDVDNTNGGDNGAETITWTSVEEDSEYIMFVYDYTGGDTQLSSSGARIAVYGENTTPIEYNVQNNGSSDRFWIVGCVNYHGFTLINKLMTTEPNDCSTQESSRRRVHKVVYPTKENNDP